MDLGGIGWHNLWKPALDLFIEVLVLCDLKSIISSRLNCLGFITLQMARFSEQNYPERLKASYVINGMEKMQQRT